MAQISLVGHNHVCPAKCGNVPHVGGPITTGNALCTINGAPVALVGDQCSCACGEPDTIVSGSSSMTINGVPVATTDSTTAHGGKIIQGDSALTLL